MTTHKRFLTLLLAAMLLIGAAPAHALAADSDNRPAFTDVHPESSYAAAVTFCWQRQLMNGISDTEFDPDGTMTRSMMATVLYRIEGEPETTAENPFLDVDADSWYGPAVLWAAERGVVEGDGTGRFAPDDYMTREQLVTILYRYAGAPTFGDPGEPYQDELAVSDWAAIAVDWSQANGILASRQENSFQPSDNALRYELAGALMNYVLYEEAKTPGFQPSDNPGNETVPNPTDPEPQPDPTDPNPQPDPTDPEPQPDPTDPEPQPGPGPDDETDPEPEPEPQLDIWEEFELLMGYRPTPGYTSPNVYAMEYFMPNEQGYMSYTGGLPYSLGVDVSSHQKEIDWQQVADAGVQFAIIRAGYRGYTTGSLNEDSYFVQNISGALNAGLQVGVYFYSQATNVREALEEAQYTLALIQGYPITFPVVFDWEMPSSTARTAETTDETIVACAIAYCETVKAAGYTPMFYASPTKAYRLELEYLSDYAFWLAHYTKDMAPSSYTNHFDMWQYTSSGSVPGIEGRVDVDICMRSDWLTPWDNLPPWL